MLATCSTELGAHLGGGGEREGGREGKREREREGGGGEGSSKILIFTAVLGHTCPRDHLQQSLTCSCISC